GPRAPTGRRGLATPSRTWLAGTKSPRPSLAHGRKQPASGGRCLCGPQKGYGEASEYRAQKGAGGALLADGGQLLSREEVEKPPAQEVGWQQRAGVAPNLRTQRGALGPIAEPAHQPRDDAEDDLVPRHAGKGANVVTPGTDGLQGQIVPARKHLFVGAAKVQRLVYQIQLDPPIREVGEQLGG